MYYNIISDRDEEIAEIIWLSLYKKKKKLTYPSNVKYIRFSDDVKSIIDKYVLVSKNHKK